MGIGLGEVAIRAVHLLRDGIPFSETTEGKIGPITLDPDLGWRATEYYQERLIETSRAGIRYDVARSQKQHGFRQFGNLEAPKPKLLVIGDSFTHATAVSDNKTYYALAGETLGMEVFAYGVGGYGTLQEYLILDRYVDEIKPDLILWQFCINDFINNDNALEQASLFNNNGLTRPYWVNGAIAHLSPKPTGQQLREWINHHSRFLYFIVSRIDRVRAVTTTASVETSIEAEGSGHAGFHHAVEVTDDLMGRVRARVGKIPIVAFSCANVAPYSDELMRISAHHGIEYWKDVPDMVQQALDHGVDVYTRDEHWNEQGHQIVASMVVKHMQDRGGLIARLQ